MKENSIDDNFEEVWGRIISTTEIKSLRQLAKIIGKTQPTISAAKAKRKFSVEWAYLVGQKYGLLTEWLMTGKGPKKLDLQLRESKKIEILKEAEEWLDDLIDKNPDRKTWFELNFLDAFPGFKKWKDEKEEKTAREDYTSTRKIA